MQMKQAIDNARGCILLAENAQEVVIRERYLKMAREWLKEADIDDWFARSIAPKVIIALEE